MATNRLYSTLLEGQRPATRAPVPRSPAFSEEEQLGSGPPPSPRGRTSSLPRSRRTMRRPLTDVRIRADAVMPIRRRVPGECQREALNSDELEWLITQKEKEETFASSFLSLLHRSSVLLSVCLFICKPCESFLPALESDQRMAFLVVLSRSHPHHAGGS